MQQIYFTGSLSRAAGAILFFIIKDGKETILYFSQEAAKTF